MPHSGAAGASPAEIRARVEVEESAFRWSPADNGADPLWCYGSTCLARHGADVFMSGIETMANVRPLHNVR